VVKNNLVIVSLILLLVAVVFPAMPLWPSVLVLIIAVWNGSQP